MLSQLFYNNLVKIVLKVAASRSICNSYPTEKWQDVCAGVNVLSMVNTNKINIWYTNLIQ